MVILGYQDYYGSHEIEVRNFSDAIKKIYSLLNSGVHTERFYIEIDADGTKGNTVSLIVNGGCLEIDCKGYGCAYFPADQIY